MLVVACVSRRADAETATPPPQTFILESILCERGGRGGGEEEEEEDYNKLSISRCYEKRTRHHRAGGEGRGIKIYLFFF